jgi:hypothetical protein
MEEGEVRSERVKVEGVFIPLHTKLAINWLSFRDSEEFFGDSKQLLRRLSTCSDSGQDSTEIPNVRRLRRDLWKIRTFCSKHSKVIPSVCVSAKVSLIGLLDHLEHLILSKASKNHVPLDSTVFLYLISKDKRFKSSRVFHFATFIPFW